MNVALDVSVSRRGPPLRAVVPTPSPPGSESVLRASILHIEKVQGKNRISAVPTGWAACSSRVCWCRSTRDEPTRATPEEGRQP